RSRCSARGSRARRPSAPTGARPCSRAGSRPTIDRGIIGNSVALWAIVQSAKDMATSLRSSYVVVGAGIHGLSTAYHLAKELWTRNLGSGADVLVLDKSAPGA